MKQQILVKGLRLVFIVSLALVLTQGPGPARAQEQTPVSDLEVSIVSVPKTARACEVFQAIYTVKNLGPDPAYNIFVGAGIPDAYHDIAHLREPYSLAVGQTATVSIVIWVGSYVPGETSHAWVTAGVSSFWQGVDVDPNPDNNTVHTEMKIVSKPVDDCLPLY